MARNDTQLPALHPASTGSAETDSSPPRDREGDPHILAQKLGQAGQRRGLRGGAPVLDAARQAYLRAEWTGAHDRRLRPGALTAAEV